MKRQDAATAGQEAVRSDLQPRCLSKAQAAAYLGLTLSGFATWVRLKRIPGSLPGTHHWDRVAIDRAIDKLSGIDVATSEVKSQLQTWIASQERKGKA